METLVEFLIYQPWWAIYVIIFTILIICGLGLPIPEDIILFTMGYCAYNGLADLKTGIVVSMVGVLLGDSMIYFMGQHFGTKLTKRGVFQKLLPEERMEKTKELFHRWGNKVIFVARFMPGLRAPVYFSAGTLHLPFRVFFSYDFLASLISVPLLIVAMYKFGDKVDYVIQEAHKIQGGIVLLVGIAIAGLVGKHFFMKSRRQ